MPRLHSLVALAIVFSGCAPVEALSPEDRAEESAASIEPLSSISCSERGDTGYRAGSSFPIRVVTVDGRPVEIDTANAYYVMAQAAARDGVEIRIVSGFRTNAEQEHLYYCYTSCSCNSCNLAARPGYSNHQSGHALDLNTSAGGVLSWLNAHGAAYGFSRTVPSEAWHWEWWGGGPGGGPCGGCTPHCEGSVMVGRDCGRGDCGAYGSRCVNDSLGLRCAFAYCPDRGMDTICLDDHTIGNCNDGALSTGDCSVYGSRCVDDALGARCAFAFCPDRGETTVCLDDHIIGTCRDGAISTGDCAAYGSRCVSDAMGARCAFFACPDSGETTICLDEHIIGTCRDGAVSTGDCSAYGAYCSTAGADAARCVSAFCVASAGDAPTPHDTCLPDGQIAHCNADGFPTDPHACPEGTTCTTSATGARCLLPGGVDPDPVPDGVDPNAPDASRGDGSVGDRDASAPDAGTGSGTRDPSGLSSGCACSARHTGGGGLAALAGVLGLLIAWRRRSPTPRCGSAT